MEGRQSITQQGSEIIGVSHVWEAREHPDPRGNQLALIARAQLWHDRYSWYFLDYMSVYQFYGHPGHDSHVLFATMTASTAVLVAYVLGIRMVSDSSK